MGKLSGPYNPDFPEGTRVQIADEAQLKKFLEEWEYHHPLTKEQIHFGNQIATVEKVSFYHGGDELYTLHGIPGLWHPQCLKTFK